MHRRIRSIVALAALLAASLTSALAVAQTTTTTATENVTASGQTNPDRIVNGVDLGESTRPMNLNPTGINYSDCISNMTLQFSVALSGFNAADDAIMEIWASRGTDCTSPIARGIGGVATCWNLGAGTPADFVAVSTVTQNFDIRVQDIIGPENEESPPITYQRFGAEACTAQPTSAAVPITLWFLPLDSIGDLLGTPYQYSLGTDLVGPPAPVGVTEAVGDTLFTVSWTPNVDADTAGYDVFIDPIPGSTTLSASDASLTQLICPDASADASSTVVEEASTDEAGSDDAQVADATTVTTVTSSGCYNAPVSTGSSGNSKGVCTSTILTGGIVIDAGTVTTDETDEAGDIIGTSVSSGSGGISTIPTANAVNLNEGFTVSSESSGSYTITGLTNGVTYNVVIAAVDGSGNVGPPSPEVCDFPAPVNDFWKLYRTAGGEAGGGFCALEAVGMPVGSTLVFGGVGVGLLALARRRRRRR